MTLLYFLVQLLSSAMLLLFSVRFMRIGIERLWSSQLRSSLSVDSPSVQNVAKGIGLGFVMQGATVVMLMAAGLVGTGAISIASAAGLAVGADLGSALAVQFLQLPMSAVGPFAILVGATAYLRAPLPLLRNIGRVVLGLGLIFLSLTMIRSSVAPIVEIEGADTVVAYLDRDWVTAALAGIVMTLLMHSSVAALLTAVAFAHHSTLGVVPALAFVLGCNVGSAVLPIWLLKSENGRARALALAVASLRCGVAGLLIPPLVLLRDVIEPIIPFSTGDAAVAGHLALNLIILPLTPVAVRIARVFEEHLSTRSVGRGDSLPAGFTDDASLALPAMKRKLSAMLETASEMLEQVISKNPDKEAITALEEQMNAGLAGIREIYSKVSFEEEPWLEQSQQILDFAIRVERCGDVLAGKYLALRLLQAKGEYQLSDEGNAEVARLVEAVKQAILLAHDTAWTGDVESAERLVRHKQKVSGLEEQSRHAHLGRVRGGNLISLQSSNQHLELIAALKEINSKFATIGYAVLEQHGALKKSRLKTAASST
ncbi:Na/Pi cotransporter family protein [Mesorhizobium sp. L-8-3]|uniref:Na/Pi cotransporter family protein n=1 Tax=Mesorhizobium sp. L-8-3 TaxID=2744522 RepID=UPI0019260849|nr:Na/Pi symporter [Mesorhizobium sp. L-8-3]